ncbi:hypothetical protein F5Y19DRAFT_102545 [Xylariaceae sp. FL1651]|nr:hypothetical protein F5Y19DRAFT_102545 [Xylariaceae sp. FL1651]
MAAPLFSRLLNSTQPSPNSSEIIELAENMDKPTNINYRGIGEGLPITALQGLSPCDTRFSLSDDGHSHPDSCYECHLYTSATEHHLRIETATKSCLPPLPTVRENQPVAFAKECSGASLTPLDRYCSDTQTHEQLAVGQIPSRQWLRDPGWRRDVLGSVTVKLLAGSHTKAPASPSSPLSSSWEGGSEDAPTIGLDDLLCLKNSPEWHAVPQEEQAKCLHKIAKLRRRLQSESSRRQVKSARVRKRQNRKRSEVETF